MEKGNLNEGGAVPNQDHAKEDLYVNCLSHSHQSNRVRNAFRDSHLLVPVMHVRRSAESADGVPGCLSFSAHSSTGTIARSLAS